MNGRRAVFEYSDISVDAIVFVTRMAFVHLRARRYGMKKAFVISAAALIAIVAAVSSSTDANAEDNFGGGVARYNRPYPVPPIAAPPAKATYHRHYSHHPYHRHHYYHHHHHYY